MFPRISACVVDDDDDYFTSNKISPAILISFQGEQGMSFLIHVQKRKAFLYRVIGLLTPFVTLSRESLKSESK